MYWLLAAPHAAAYSAASGEAGKALGNVAEIISAAGAGPLAFFALGVLVLAYLSTKWFGSDGIRVRLAVFLLILGLICLTPFLISLVAEGGAPRPDEVTRNAAAAAPQNASDDETSAAAPADEEPLIANGSGTSALAELLDTSALDECYGRSWDPQRGTFVFDRVCMALLAETAASLKPQLVGCAPVLDGRKAQLEAAASLAHQIGPPTFCRSSIAELMQEGNWRGACEAFLSWDKLDGRRMQALVNRRAFERDLCLRDLP